MPDAQTQETKAQVAVLNFDEESGKLLKRQIQFEDAAVAEPERELPVSLPWKQWQDMHVGMGVLGCRQSFRSRGLKPHS